MDNALEIEIAQAVPDLSTRDRSALFSCGLWLRLGYVGAFAIAGVLIQLFNGQMKPLSALGLAAGAATLMAVSWWRARAALEGADATVAATAATTATVASPADDASVCVA
jgi:hypothetical protein